MFQVSHPGPLVVAIQRRLILLRRRLPIRMRVAILRRPIPALVILPPIRQRAAIPRRALMATQGASPGT